MRWNFWKSNLPINFVKISRIVGKALAIEIQTLGPLEGRGTAVRQRENFGRAIYS